MQSLSTNRCPTYFRALIKDYTPAVRLIMEINPQLKLASDYLHYTGKNVFLTGKAGTGKTTFLRELKKTIHKRMVIVAPTGVAAINAGGTTIHSFFQLPFGPFIPDNQTRNQKSYQFGKEKVRLIKSIDLLVIDEVSMVRSDTLDSIDAVLRQYRNKNLPFGGVQLLMIGDLFQLSPVVKEEEWNLLRPYYDTIFFFSSRSLKQTNPVTIELTHIYRQSDRTFIDILNKIRENDLNKDLLRKLNERYIPDFNPEKKEGYITLTTHNSSAQTINSAHLENLKGKTWSFEAETSGDFPPISYPTDAVLILKKGAQVMFIKNDVSKDKLFYNGKIGTVTSISDEGISVRCEGDYTDIEVNKAAWYHVKYALNPETKEIEEQIIGQFEQYPLKLAWAITIHKSQGLTFEKVIIDASASFAHGQVYVALSRCKSLEGLVLSSKIRHDSIKTDYNISGFTQEASYQQPDNEHLRNAKIDYQKSLLIELFDFSDIQRSYFQLLRLLEENGTVILPATLDFARETSELLKNEVLEISRRFTNELYRHLNLNNFPEDDELIQERLRKAIGYFIPKINELLQDNLHRLAIDTDNAALQKSLRQAKENLAKSVFIKVNCLEASRNTFRTADYLRTRNNADIDFKPENEKLQSTDSKDSSDLFEALRAWRNNVAAENNVLDYMVMPMKVIVELVKTRPTTIAELTKVKGIGKLKAKKYGLEILEIILTHTE